MKTFPYLAALVCLCTSAAAQEYSFKFGKIAPDELTMTSYAPEPDAEAVFIYDDTDIHYVFGKSIQVECYRSVKIKVLKDEGVRWGDVTIDRYHRQLSKETVSRLSAARLQPCGRQDGQDAARQAEHLRRGDRREHDTAEVLDPRRESRHRHRVPLHLHLRLHRDDPRRRHSALHSRRTQHDARSRSPNISPITSARKGICRCPSRRRSTTAWWPAITAPATPSPNTPARSIGFRRSGESPTSGISTTSAQGSNSKSTACPFPAAFTRISPRPGTTSTSRSNGRSSAAMPTSATRSRTK